MPADLHAVSAARVGEDLERAVSETRKSGSNRLILDLDSDIRASATFADHVIAALGGADFLDELVLVHASPAFGFLASALQLRLQSVRVKAKQGAWLSSEPAPPAPAPTPSAAPPGDRAIARLSAKADAAEAHAQMLALGEAEACFVVFDASARPERGCINGIVEALEAMPKLEQITLVHDSPSIGFLASSLSLRAPRITVLTSSPRDAGIH